MGEMGSVRSLRGNDALCWQEAVRLHNAKQTSPSSKKYIHLETREHGGQCGPNESSAQEYAYELMVTTKGSYERLRKKHGPFATALLQIYSTLRQYSHAVDMLAQADPTIAALVWGSVSFLLQMGEEEERASRIASEGVLEIVRHAGRWEQVSDISDILESTRLRKALVVLYTAILDFLMSSSKWLGRGTMERLGISILTSKGDAFDGKLRELRNASELVDKELQTQATYKSLDSFGEIKFDVHSIMDKIDKQTHHLSAIGAESRLQLQLDNDLLALMRKTNGTVVSELKSLPSSIGHTILDQMEGTLGLTRLRQWLVLSAVEISPPATPTDGTCHWFLQHPSFLQWTRSEESRVFWMQANQGFGKSVMAGYLYEHLTAEGSNTLFYRFQRSASTTQSTPTSFASSLIYQLLEKSPMRGSFPSTDAYHKLQSLATQCPLGPQQCAFKAVWAVAASMLKMCGLRFKLIIDALDECSFDGPSLPGVSAFFNALFGSIRESRSKVVIFTQPEPMFYLASESDLSMSMDEGLVLPDIMIFAKIQYEQLGLPDSEMDGVLKFVCSHSHGSFRWVELFLDHIGRSLQPADIRARMQTLPPSMRELHRESLLSGVRRFGQDELQCRNALLSVAFQAQRTLRTTEIADAFSLRPEKAEIIISRLCKPLASTLGGFFQFSHPSVREFLDLYHQAGDDSLGILLSDCHSLLAEKCLSCLLGERWANLHRIRSYLTANYDENAFVDADAQDREGSFYDYASRFWDYHLTLVKAPSKNLLRRANTFILSLQFAYWSERSRKECGQLIRANVALASLLSWRKGLSREDQECFELDKYFEQPYSLLGAAFASSQMDKVPEWLARMTLGDFYFFRLLADKAISTRQQVLVGLQGLLGPRHHLTLIAKSGVAYVCFYADKMRLSNRMYNEVAELQREVLGSGSSHYLETLLYKGQSDYYMADFAAAFATWTKLSVECLERLGPDSWLYLAAQLWYAHAGAYMGELESALQISQSVMEKRWELFGLGDSFANVVQATVGEIQLLLGRHVEAIATIQGAIVRRRVVYPPTHPIRLDTEITLATAYQAAGMRQAALPIVKEIEERVTNLRSRFKSYCQVVHLKGILLAEEGSIDEAIHLLQDTVTQAEQDQNNRALLWIRLDLATLLRRRDAEGDRDQASANFDNIVKDISGHCESGFPDEPDPPRLLAAAEKALRLVRARKHAEARRELESEQLDWCRPSDFWLWVGGAFCRDLLQIPD